MAWLTDLHYEEYYELFVSAGYDMPTISRMTPEDLTAIGIKKPNHRKRLKSEITLLNIPDGLPPYIPVSKWCCIILSGKKGGCLVKFQSLLVSKFGLCLIFCFILGITRGVVTLYPTK